MQGFVCKYAIFSDRNEVGAQAGWFKNTPLLPQRVKSGSIPGFALLFPLVEEPCPLSLPYGFFTTQPELFRITEFEILSIWFLVVV
jgi:hypothetical protein